MCSSIHMFTFSCWFLKGRLKLFSESRRIFLYSCKAQGYWNVKIRQILLFLEHWLIWKTVNKSEDRKLQSATQLLKLHGSHGQYFGQ